MRLPNTIETISGLEFDYTAPVVTLDDVAHGLAHVCRFAGHTSRFYSVAEHSVLVARLVWSMAPDLALMALWHDAHEAYMGDLPTPLKAIVGSAYKTIAERIDGAVYEYLDANPDETSIRHPAIKLADELAVVYEAAHLKWGDGWEFTRAMKHPQAEAALPAPIGLDPAAAIRLFNETHTQLTRYRLTPPHMRCLIFGDLNPVVA